MIATECAVDALWRKQDVSQQPLSRALALSTSFVLSTSGQTVVQESQSLRKTPLRLQTGRAYEGAYPQPRLELNTLFDRPLGKDEFIERANEQSSAIRF